MENTRLTRTHSFFRHGPWQILHDLPCKLIFKNAFDKGFPGGSVAQEADCQAKRRGFDPWSRKIHMSSSSKTRAEDPGP